MAGSQRIAVALVALTVAGCGGAQHQPASFKGQFDVHGGRPEIAGVSGEAPVPSLTLCSAAEARKARVATVNRCVVPDRTAAARIKRRAVELRSGNTKQNHRVPTAAELAAYRARSSVSAPELVTGRFKGTTDEILRWVAAKWSIDPDIVRAVAYVESRWRMSTVGDGGVSFGIMQVKSTVHLGTKPLSQQSTAFNADYWAAVVRDYYNGREAWLNDVEHGRPYKAGDLWGSIGAWYAGRWHTEPAERYISEVKAALADKPWTKSRF